MAQSLRSDGKTHSAFLREAVAVLLLGSLVLFIHRFMLMREHGHPAYFIRWDLWQFMWPKLSFLTDSLRQGIWPLWDPYDFAGTPLSINLQTLFYNPMVTLYAYFVGFSIRHLQLYLLLLFLFGAANLYVLARTFSVHRLPSVALAALYTVSGFALGNAQNLPQQHLFFTEPLTIALLYRFITNPGRGAFLLATAGICLLVSGGYPSILGHLLVFNLLFGIWLTTGLPHRWNGIVRLMSVHTVAFLVMSPMLIPALQSYPYISRSQGLDFSTYVSASLSPPYLLGFLNPFLGSLYVGGTPDNIVLRNCTIGIPVAILVIFSALKYEGRRFLLTYFLLALLGLLGAHTPLSHVLYKIPILSNSQCIAYEFRVLAIFIAYLLAVMAFKDFCTETRRELVLISLLVPCIGGGLVLLLLSPYTYLSGVVQCATIYLKLPLAEETAFWVILSLPLLLTAGYYSCRQHKSELLFLCLCLLEATSITGLSYYTVMGPMPTDSGWANIDSDEQSRPKNFPLPNPFYRQPRSASYMNNGCVFKVHTDWGYDSTILTTFDSLVRSTNASCFFDPYMSIQDLDGDWNAQAVTFCDYGPNNVSLTFPPESRPVLARFNFMYYPGWKATSQGSQRRCEADMNGRVQVRLESGDAQIELRFRPAWVTASWVISIIMMTGLLVWYGLSSKKRTDQGQPAGTTPHRIIAS